MKAILVSAANSRFFPMLRDWLDSLDHVGRPEGVDLGVADVGLEPGERAEVESRATVVDPGWDFDLGRQAGAPEHVKSLTLRPWLPRYFPGYDVYVWMDADTWVQDWAGVDLVIRAATTGALAACPEVHRSFNAAETELKVEKVLGIPYRVTSFSFRRYRDIYGTDTARELFDRPVLNCGVFGMAADAPHWEPWRKEYQRALHASRRGAVDQLTLNYVAHTSGLAVERLPATSNWVLHRALPAWDEERSLLVAPDLPHETIGVLHMTMGTKDGEYDLPTLGGGTVRRSLRYSGGRPPGRGAAQ